MVADSGLITITGGKWTTYRKMAEETVDQARQVAGLPQVPCPTAQLKIHGFATALPDDALKIYGSDSAFIRELITYEPALGQPLHPDFPQVAAEVVWAVRHEMARTVEDVLARRLRILFLDARAARTMAPRVAALVARELGYDLAWQETQIREFTLLTNNYLLEPLTTLTTTN